MSQIVYYTPDSEIKTECASEALALKGFDTNDIIRSAMVNTMGKVVFY